MKTYNQFCTESYSARENLQEIVISGALLGAAKLASMGLSAYSAYSAAKNLRKGNYKGAALDALGVLPAGGLAFKAAQRSGAGLNLARSASAATSAARWSSPARNRPIDKGFEMATNAITGSASAKPSQSTPTQPAKPTQTATKTQPVKPTQPVAKPRVLSKLGGVEGTGVGKDFVAKKWSSAESDRYKRVAAANKLKATGK